MGLIDFELDTYDYLTFVIFLAVVIGFFYVIVTLGGLPGKMAEKRNHPHAESVKLGGWIGLFTVFPWIHALIWAYHDSLTVDIRELPDGGAGKAGSSERLKTGETLEAGSAPAMPLEVEAGNVLPSDTRDGASA
ncbi:DUF3302 domain-containing protein [Roseibium sp.]|uniref:DUF3302 domain-containing protein n=1 Tax=Roseibium sp. TaxID=1936156 RepID=UPI0032636F5B